MIICKRKFRLFIVDLESKPEDFHGYVEYGFDWRKRAFYVKTTNRTTMLGFNPIKVLMVAMQIAVEDAHRYYEFSQSYNRDAIRQRANYSRELQKRLDLQTQLEAAHSA